jgi:hypothetical protein
MAIKQVYNAGMTPYSALPNQAAMNQLNPSSPTPGGPNPATASTARDSLREDLANDLAKSQQITQAQSNKLGAPDFSNQFAEKGIMLGKRIVAQNELSNTLAAQKAAIRSYLTASGFTDANDFAHAELILNDKYNKMRLSLLQQGQEFNRQIEAQGVDAKKKAQIANNLGSLVNTGVKMFFSGGGSGDSEG